MDKKLIAVLAVMVTLTAFVAAMMVGCVNINVDVEQTTTTVETSYQGEQIVITLDTGENGEPPETVIISIGVGMRDEMTTGSTESSGNGNTGNNDTGNNNTGNNNTGNTDTGNNNTGNNNTGNNNTGNNNTGNNNTGNNDTSNNNTGNNDTGNNNTGNNDTGNNNTGNNNTGSTESTENTGNNKEEVDTQSPTTPDGGPNLNLSFEVYKYGMTGAEQMAFAALFDSDVDFIEKWFDPAREAYKKQNQAIEVTGESINIQDYTKPNSK